MKKTPPLRDRKVQNSYFDYTSGYPFLVSRLCKLYLGRQFIIEMKIWRG